MFAPASVPLDEQIRADLILLRTHGLQHVHREQRTDLGGALQPEAPGQGGEEAGPETVADTGRVIRRHLASDRHVDGSALASAAPRFWR